MEIKSGMALTDAQAGDYVVVKVMTAKEYEKEITRRTK